MDIKEIAEELVAGCRENRAEANLDKLYAPDAASVEAEDFSGMGRETKGVDGIKGKHAWWEENFEYHGGDIKGPYVFDNKFAVFFEIDATMKATGERSQMSEVALYTVEDGKIVREEFFG